MLPSYLSNPTVCGLVQAVLVQICNIPKDSGMEGLVLGGSITGRGGNSGWGLPRELGHWGYGLEGNMGPLHPSLSHFLTT